MSGATSLRRGVMSAPRLHHIFANLWKSQRYPLGALGMNRRILDGSALVNPDSRTHCVLPGCGNSLLAHPGGNNQGANYGKRDQRAVSSCAGAFKLGQHQLNGLPGRADLRRAIRLPAMHRGLVDAEALGEGGLRLTEADARVFDHLWGNRHAVIMHSA